MRLIQAFCLPFRSFFIFLLKVAVSFSIFGRLVSEYTLLSDMRSIILLL